ncbi:golgin subfamily B member 1-like isoform X1 [Senna tora]|uniref:Golgin subfamily B member 1-like isoform X1 n=1 Tax=Senna tora TaxID=362788 RepID=A0A834WDX5_9FABA|nr:golgin subfamily B member 1-like isoform X1 [Senna tora]
MSENHEAEQLPEDHGATEQGIQEGPSDSSAEMTLEQSNGISQLPFESATHTNQDDVTVGTLPGNAVEATNQGDRDDVKPAEDAAKDDMFVDCSDELSTFDGKQTDFKEELEAGKNKENSEENQQGHSDELHNEVGDGLVGNTVTEKGSVSPNYKEEGEMFAQGVLDLHCQLKALSCQQSLPNEAEDGVKDNEVPLADVPLKKMIKECLGFVKTASEDRSNAEATIQNLQALLSEKDREIENLSMKVTELLVSHDNSAQKISEVSSEIQLEEDRNIDVVIDRIMSSLATVVNQEQVLDNSISRKIVHIEEGTALLVEKYNNILSEIYQFGQSFSEAGMETREQEYGNVLVAAHGGLLELKRKEAELLDKLAYLEDENKKLVEELDKERVMIGTLNGEIGNMKVELEQEKGKCANIKEKLSMAVTKGKALVQQRDSLKQSLAEKSSEHEKCLIELQEKLAELEAARLTKDELVQSENMVASLQNSLLQSNTIIEQVEKLLSQTELEKPELLDMLERVRWVVEDRNALKGAFFEFCKLKDALSLINLPEYVSSSDLESQINWLRDTLYRARDDTNTLQEEISTIREAAYDCIDCLSASFLLESQEKYYLQSELADLSCKYEKTIEMNHLISMEKDHIVKKLVELSGYNQEDEGIDHSSSDTSMIINLCFEMIKHQSGSFTRSSHIDTELFERIQSHLYVRDQGLMLCEDILEEDMLIRLEVNKLSNELKTLSDEILALKEEKSSLQKDLDRSEDKSAMLRDKLSMAVKKGKGLVQDRDNLRSLINEKNSEIEQLKLDLQKQESVVSEDSDQINKLSSNLENIPKLEAELQAIKSERNQFEQFLLESNNLLQRVMESIDRIVLPVESDFKEPLEKVRWLAGFVSECQDAKLHAEQELQLVKEGASDLESKLAEAQATENSLEQALFASENNISQVAEEKSELEFGKAKVEEELYKVKEELAEVSESIMSLRDALSEAERDIAVLSNEKELVQTGRAAAETELERAKEEVAKLTSKLEEASTTIKDLEEVGESTMSLRAALTQAEKDIAVLSNEKELAQTDRAAAETELERAKEEVARLTSKLEEVSATIKDLEEVGESTVSLRAALSQAEKDIAVHSNEKELAQTGRAAAETELERAKEEITRLTSKLEEASATIKDLEEVGESTMSLRAALSQAEKDIAFHSSEEELAHTGRTAAETELERAKEEIASMTSKLEEASATIKDLEEVGESTMSLRAALSQAEKDIAVLSSEKELAHTGRAAAETELERVKEEVSRLTSRLAESSVTIKDLEEVGESTMLLRAALSQAEKDVAVLANEKELAQTGRAAAETELERVKEEAAKLSSKLAEASLTIKNLEDMLSQAESNVNLFKEKCNADQVIKTNMENELKKLEDEAEHQASKLVDSSATIKSLEDALSKAQNDISVLEDANKIAKEEISSLSFKLNSCLDELSGKNGSLENRSIELIGLLNDLKVLMKEDALLPRVKLCFERKFESLKNIDFILNNIRDYTVGMNAKDPGRHSMNEEDPLVRTASFDGIENFDVEVDSRVIDDTDIDNMISLFGKIVKGFQLRNKLIADRFDDFSDSIDQIISLLQKKLLETETDILSISEHTETLKEKVHTSESLREEQENTIATLENDIRVLLDACTNASSELQFEVYNNLVEPGPISEIMNLDADALAKHHRHSKYLETAQKLMTAARKAQNLIEQFELRSKEVDTTIGDLQSQLNETRSASEKVIEERDLSQRRVLELESEIQVLQNSCSELRDNLEGYHALEEKLKEKEAEISSLYSALSVKQEAENSLLSASQVRTLFGKIDRIEIPFVESGEEDMESNTSAPVGKLFYIIDSITRLHHQMNSLSQDKEELQTTLATKVLEIKHLEEEVKQLNSNREDLEKVKNELSEFTFALGKVLGMLGDSDWVEDKKSTGLKELIPLLEKQVVAFLLESENAKSKVQELGGKLLGSQKVIDELTTKVRLLEGSLNDKTSQPEIVQERSISEAPPLPAGSEISEVEEGSLGKKVITPVPSAALVRNMRKGSADHLALDIGGESDRLISSSDIDEDKGHVFKALNTSGFVPQQGKLIADRIDGFWVSGGRLLMSRPRARLGLIGYLLVLHIWLLATIV